MSGYLVSRFGTTVAFALGCSYACAGYAGLWLATEVLPGQLPLEALFLFCFLFGHGCGSIDTATMTELVSSFPDYKGYVVGCAKSYYGLATATVATIYKVAFAPQRTSFLLFLAVYSAVAGMMLTPVIQKFRAQVIGSRSAVTFRFRLMILAIIFYSTLFLVVQLSKLTLIQSRFVLAAVLLGATLPFSLAYSRKNPLAEDLETVTDTDMAGSEVRVVQPAPVDLTGFEVFRCLNFYILMIVLVIAQGAGLLFIANSAQILPAMLGRKADATAFVAIISIFNAIGRLAFGAGSELLSKPRWPKSCDSIFAVVLLLLLSLLLRLLRFEPLRSNLITRPQFLVFSTCVLAEPAAMFTLLWCVCV